MTNMACIRSLWCHDVGRLPLTMASRLTECPGLTGPGSGKKRRDREIRCGAFSCPSWARTRTLLIQSQACCQLHQGAVFCHGAEGDRTPDLCSAIAALSQLSYSPMVASGPATKPRNLPVAPHRRQPNWLPPPLIGVTGSLESPSLQGPTPIPQVRHDDDTSLPAH